MTRHGALSIILTSIEEDERTNGNGKKDTRRAYLDDEACTARPAAVGIVGRGGTFDVVAAREARRALRGGGRPVSGERLRAPAAPSSSWRRRRRLSPPGTQEVIVVLVAATVYRRPA